MQVGERRGISLGGLVLLVVLFIAVIAAIAQMAGCSSLGLQPAKGLDQQIAYADGVSAAALNALTAGIGNGAIGYAQAEKLNSEIVQANQLLDTARSLESSNPTGAQTSLTTALNVLNAVQAVLQSASSHPAGASP